jgi:hypothetical protein
MIPRIILNTCGVTIVLFLLSLVWVIIPEKQSTAALASFTITLLVGLPLVIASSAILLRRIADRPKAPNFERGLAARTLALLITVGLIASYVLLDKSLWSAPGDNRYIYESAAIIITLLSLLLVIVLNAVQAEVYWITSRAARTLGKEYEAKRRRVFETSYKLLAVLFVLSAYNLVGYARDAETLTAINFAHFPESMSWLAFNVIVAAVAMPLLVAAFRRK